MASRQHGSLDERWTKLLAERGRSARLSGARGPSHKPRTVVVPMVELEAPKLPEVVANEPYIASDRSFDSIDTIASLGDDHRFLQALAPGDVQALRVLLREFRSLTEAAFRPVSSDGDEHAQMESKIHAMSNLQAFLGTKLNRVFALINRGACT